MTFFVVVCCVRKGPEVDLKGDIIEKVVVTL